MRFLAAFLIFSATAVSSQDIRLPSDATMTSDVSDIDVSGDIPIGPWQAGNLPTQSIEGDYRRQTWKFEGTGLTTAQIMRSLKEQLANAGYTVIFDCNTNGCGGFDFRFAIDVATPPEMVVNLADFRFLSAQQANGETVTAIASQMRGSGYLQLIRIGRASVEDELEPSLDALSRNSRETVDLAALLETQGYAILEDLAFEIGSARLTEGQFESLRALSTFLLSHPDTKVTLVGHTDSEGALDGNIQLSKRRAGSVLERLVTEYDIDRQQLSAEGMGYLAPVATNRTEEGREANRRVEVIVNTN